MSSDKLDYNGLDTLSTVIKDFVLKKLNIEITNAKQYADKLTPIGTIQVFAGNSLPNGWLLCDGSAVSRSTYSNLFGVIGTIYGNGDGSTTFNLPNLTDKFIQGNNTVGTVKNAGLPNIEGSVTIHGGENPSILYTFSGAMYCAGGSNSQYRTPNDLTLKNGASSKGYLHFSANKSNTIYGSSTTVQPPSLTMRYIIKY